MDRPNRFEHLRGRGINGAKHAQLVGQNIEQHFRITAGIDMPQVFRKQVAHQLFGIRQIAVMSQRNAIG